MPAPGSGVSSSITWLQTSISPGRWARSIHHLLGAQLALLFHEELNMAHRVQRDAPSAAPHALSHLQPHNPFQETGIALLFPVQHR